MLSPLVHQTVVDLVGEDERPRQDRAAIRSAESSVPVGLAGELMRMALVRDVSRAFAASGRNWKPSSSATSTQASVPPQNRMKFG